RARRHGFVRGRGSSAARSAASPPTRRSRPDGMPSTRETCAPEAGRVRPVIDRGRCEAKEDCVRVCPYDVFVVRRVTPEERLNVPLVGRMKRLFPGGKQAFVVHEDACHACGLCVKACPEKAIRLEAI